MAAIADDTIRDVVSKLFFDVYEHPFRGKERGRFCLTREQVKRALGTKQLRTSTIQRLQDEALSVGLVIIDLDDRFPCLETKVARGFRRPPEDVFIKIFPEVVAAETAEGDDEFGTL